MGMNFNAIIMYGHKLDDNQVGKIQNLIYEEDRTELEDYFIGSNYYSESYSDYVFGIELKSVGNGAICFDLADCSPAEHSDEIVKMEALFKEIFPKMEDETASYILMSQLI